MNIAKTNRNAIENGIRNEHCEKLSLKINLLERTGCLTFLELGYFACSSAPFIYLFI